MREVSATEAKTHLLRLLDDIEAGETIVITRHGRPIARVLPEGAGRMERSRAAMQRILARREGAPHVEAEEILAWKNEGRR